MFSCRRTPSTGGCAGRAIPAEWGGQCNAPMPPAYDLIIERGGSIVVETIEACDEDAAWRAGLMLHIEALMAVVCRDEHDPESTRA